jgi:hypothetical protein
VGELLQQLAGCARDPGPSVRAAAVLVVTLLMQGLGRDAFRVLQHALRDL